MRCLIVFITILFSTHHCSAQAVITQDISNERLSVILRNWSAEFNLDFAFDSYELARYRFTGKLQSAPVDDALNQVLSETPFVYRWLGETYVIYPRADVKQNLAQTAPVKRLLTGRIIDRLSGETLPFASVGAVKSGIGTAADADGKFSLRYDGEITRDTLVIAFVGYQLFRTPISWDELPAMVVYELVTSDAVLPDVEIQSQLIRSLQQETPPGVFTIRPNSSGLRSGVGESDVFRLAQFAPGISGVQENSNGLYIRGSSSGQSQLLLDGFNIYHQDHFFGMFSSVNAYAVKSMRVNKVFNEPSQGGRTAGSVELTGREGDLRKPSARMEVGTMSISGALETPLDSTGKAALFICGRRSITDYIKGPAYREIFKTLYSSSIVATTSTDAEEAARKFDPQLLFQDINAKITFRPAFNHHFNACFYASRDALNFNYADTSSAENVNVSDIRYSDESAKSNRGLSLRWSAQLSPRIEVINSLGYSQFRGFYFSTDSIRNNLFGIDSTQFSFRDVTLHDWSALNSWKWKSRRHELKWGIAFNHVNTNNKQRSSENPESIDVKSGFTTTVFAGDEIRRARWIIQPGMRFNIYNLSTNRGYWEPRFSIRYALINSRLFLKAAVSRSLQFVQRITNQSMYQNVPDQWQPASEDVPILTSNQVLVGVNHTGQHWSADLEAYYKLTDGQVLDAAAGQFSSGILNQFYVGNSRIAGLDATLQYEKSPHKLLVSASWLSAQSNYNGFDVTDISETYNRRMEGKAAYEWTKGAWNASFFFIAAGGAPYTAWLGSYLYPMPDGTQRPVPLYGGYNRALTQPYLRADLAGSYRWQWNMMRWQVVLSVYNLFDTPNYRALQYSVAPNSIGVNAREIRMLGRIPSINLICQF